MRTITQKKQEIIYSKAYFDGKKELLEFHVDDAEVFMQVSKHWPLKGNLSIRRNLNFPIYIVIGQDESIFLPHTLKNRYWTFDGHIPQRNKTEGIGVMISLCITREFGWNFNLNEEELKKVLSKVNAKRENEHYLNIDAAITLFGSSEKSKNELKDNPFYKEFDYGKNRDGYWDGNHTALQLEDVADFFCTLFSNKQYQIIFELDHSQCYKRFMKNAHIVKHFNLGPGGSVPIVRNVCAGKDSIGPYFHQDM